MLCGLVRYFVYGKHRLLPMRPQEFSSLFLLLNGAARTPFRQTPPQSCISAGSFLAFFSRSTELLRVLCFGKDRLFLMNISAGKCPRFVVFINGATVRSYSVRPTPPFFFLSNFRRNFPRLCVFRREGRGLGQRTRAAEAGTGIVLECGLELGGARRGLNHQPSWDRSPVLGLLLLILGI